MDISTVPASNNNRGEAVVGGGGAYGPTGGHAGEVYEPIGERQFVDMFTTDRSSRPNGRTVSHIDCVWVQELVTMNY